MPFKVIILPVLVILFTANMSAEIISQDKCIVFTGENGDTEVKFCPGGDGGLSKANVPVKIGDQVWDQTFRYIDRSARLMPASRNAFVFVENFRDMPAVEDARYKEKCRYTAEGLIPGGYRLRYFGADGRVLWDKAIIGEGQVEDQRISHDGSTIVLLMRPGSSPGYPPQLLKGKPSKWVTVYNAKGVRLLHFPPRSGICNLHGMTNFWLSRTGNYMMTACYDKTQHVSSYFFQPRARLFWATGHVYQISGNGNMADEEDEEFGRVDLTVCKTTPRSISCETTNLVLSGGDWRPMKALR